MVLTYGSYSFPAGEAEVRYAKQMLFSDVGARDIERVTVQVSGRLEGSTYSGFESDLSSMKAALDSDDVDFSLAYPDSTAATHLALYAGSCITGPRITSMEYPESTGAEMAPGGIRTYGFTVEAEIALSGSKGNVISFQESITFTQGEPIYQIVETIQGPARIYKTCEQTAYILTQEGEAVGLTSYPNPPAALYPDQLIQRAPTRKDSPTMVKVDSNGTATTTRYFRTGWSYQMAAGTDFFGGTAVVPNNWLASS
jgi:hypothetical protein